MTNEEKKEAIENYIRAYNSFDIEEMLADLDERIIFKNISGGELTHELEGIEDFRAQTVQAAEFFTDREQKITGFSFAGDACEIEIDYRATIAIDFPNGLKAGDRL